MATEIEELVGLIKLNYEQFERGAKAIAKGFGQMAQAARPADKAVKQMEATLITTARSVQAAVKPLVEVAKQLQGFAQKVNAAAAAAKKASGAVDEMTASMNEAQPAAQSMVRTMIVVGTVARQLEGQMVRTAASIVAVGNAMLRVRAIQSGGMGGMIVAGAGAGGGMVSGGGGSGGGGGRTLALPGPGSAGGAPPPTFTGGVGGGTSGSLNAFLSSAQAGIRRLQSAFAPVVASWGRAIGDLTRMVQRLGLAIGAVATGLTAALIKTGVDFDSLKQKAMIAFETMIGSAQGAQKFFGDLKAFATRTPFQLAGLIETSQQLIALGFRAEQVIPILTNVGDAVAGLGGSPEKLNRIIVAIGQMQAKGKVSAQEMNQLAEAGVGAWKMLADELGISIPEAMKKAEDGMISSAQAIPIILAGMDARFGGLMEKMSKTFSGRLANLADVAQITAGEIVQPLFDATSDGLGALQQAFGSPAILANINWLKNVFFGLGQSITQVLRQSGQQIVDQTLTLLGKIVEITIRVGTEATRAAPRVLELATAFMRLIDPLLELIARYPEIVAFFALFTGAQILGITTFLQSLGQAIFYTATAIGSALAPEIVALIGLFGGGAIAAGVIAWKTGELERVFNHLWKMIQVGVANVMPDLEKTWNQIVATADELWRAIKVVAAAIGTDLMNRIDAAMPYIQEFATEMMNIANAVLPRIRELLPGLALMLKDVAEWFGVKGVESIQNWGDAILVVTRLIRGMIDATMEMIDKLTEGSIWAKTFAQTMGDADKATQTMELFKMARNIARGVAGQGNANAAPAGGMAGLMAAMGGAPANAGGAGGRGVNRGVPGMEAGAAAGGAAAVEGPDIEGANKTVLKLWNELDQMRLKGEATAAQQHAFTAQMQQLLDLFAAGKITENEFEVALDGVDKKMKEAGDRVKDLQEFSKELDTLGRRGEITRQTAVQLSQGVAQLQQGLANGRLTADQFSDGMAALEKRMQEAESAVDGVTNAHKSMLQQAAAEVQAGNLTGAQMQWFTGKLNELQQQFFAGTMTAQQFAFQSKLLNDGMQETANRMEGGRNAIKNMAQSMLQMQANGELTQQQVDGFAKRMFDLKAAFESGTISIFQLNSALSQLDTQAKQMADDAERRKQLGPLARLTAGMPEGDFRRAVEQQLLQFQQSQMSDRVREFTERLLAANGILPRFSQGLQQATAGFQRFVGWSQEQWSGMQQQVSAFGQAIQNVGVQAAVLRNNISLEWQRYNTLAGINMQSAMKVLDGIRRMEAQLRDLMSPQAPLFSEYNIAGILRDPGLSGGSAGGSQTISNSSASITINAANMNPREMVRALEDEAARRGVKLWGKGSG